MAGTEGSSMADKTDDQPDGAGRRRPRGAADPAARAFDPLGGREPREVRDHAPAEGGPPATAPAGPQPFAVYLDLAGNEWRTWDQTPGLGKLPRKMSAGTDADRGWAFKAAFEAALKSVGATPADLAIDGGGRYLHFSGRAARDELTVTPDFTAVLVAYLSGVRGARPGRAVVYHPGDGGWVRVGFSTAPDPPKSPAPAGRTPGDHPVFPARTVTALAAQRASRLPAADAAARLQPLLDELAGRAAAWASQARAVTDDINAVLGEELELVYAGRPVRLSVTNLAKTAGSFQLRTFGTGKPTTVCSSRTFPPMTVVPSSHG
jgi:hypothetical protein